MHTAMNTEKDTARKSTGKTIIIKYSTWNKGQDFSTVLQTVPEGNKKVLIGRIHFDRNGEEKTYTAKGADGQVLHTAKNSVEIEKYFTEHGPELAQQELQKKQTVENEKAVAPSTERETPQPPAVAPNPTPIPETPEKELDEIRAQKAEKSQDKNITR